MKKRSQRKKKDLIIKEQGLIPGLSGYKKSNGARLQDTTGIILRLLILCIQNLRMGEYNMKI
jgi:hypothetical protein